MSNNNDDKHDALLEKVRGRLTNIPTEPPFGWEEIILLNDSLALSLLERKYGSSSGLFALLSDKKDAK